MRRKDYRDRQPVTISLEKERYRDFTDLCDKERKSISFKFSEMVEEELQKNAVGEVNPIRIRYVEEQNKPIQTDLMPWLERVDAIESQKELLMLKGQGSALLKRVDMRSKELYFQGIRE